MVPNSPDEKTNLKNAKIELSVPTGTDTVLLQGNLFIIKGIVEKAVKRNEVQVKNFLLTFLKQKKERTGIVTHAC